MKQVIRLFLLMALGLAWAPSALAHPVPTFGPQPQVFILFRYADVPDTPAPMSFFETLVYSNQFPSLNHYFREVSYNHIDLSGSLLVGWFNLPGEYSYYNWDKNGNGWPELDWDRVVPDCMALADPYVYFPNFTCIHMLFNANQACDPPGLCSGSIPDFVTNVDGQTKQYGLTLLSPFWYQNVMAVFPHETFHTFGVHHTGDMNTDPTMWDAVSTSGTCVPPHPTYGCLPVHPISWNKLELGWIPPARCYNSGAAGAGIFAIERLALPPMAPGTYQMAKLLMLGSPNLFYTVEYRTLDGWDGAGTVPGRGVLLNWVNPTLEDFQARVVDGDANGDPNDAGAMWVPGETFLDAANQVVAHVESWTASTAVVSMSNKARNPVYVNWSNAGAEDGSVLYPWNTVAEGYSSVRPQGSVYLAAGNYGEAMYLSKPCTLSRSGTSGAATIGR